MHKLGFVYLTKFSEKKWKQVDKIMHIEWNNDLKQMHEKENMCLEWKGNLKLVHKSNNTVLAANLLLGNNREIQRPRKNQSQACSF